MDKKTFAAIEKATSKVSKLYDKYREESHVVEKLVRPHIRKALKSNDLKLLSELLDATRTKGYGDYLGRFDIFLAIQTIKHNQKKKS